MLCNTMVDINAMVQNFPWLRMNLFQTALV